MIDRDPSRFEDAVVEVIAALEPGELQGSQVSHLRLAPQDGAVSSAPAGAMPWTTGWLPNGFTMATADIRRKIETDSTVSILMYSDGLASFSIFVEELPDSGAAQMISQHGATVAVTHMLETGDGNYLVTLVGEIPLATAQQIIRTVQRKG